MQNRNRLTDVENKPVFAKGERGGGRDREPGRRELRAGPWSARDSGSSWGMGNRGLITSLSLRE